MKKTIALLCLTLCHLCGFADYTGTVTTNTVELNFSTQSGYDYVALADNYFTQEVGAPQLPVKVMSFLVPIDQMVTGVVINSTTTTTLPGTYNVYPCQTLTHQPGSLPFDNPNPVIYGSSTPYPVSSYTVTDDGYPMGYHVITIRFCPVQYIPSTQTLKVFTAINFTLVYATNTAEVLRPNRQSSYSNTLSKNYIKSLVANPGDLATTSGGARQVVGVGSSTASFRGMTPTEVVTIPDYIIITSAALVGTSGTGFKKLSNWKTQKGVYTMIVTIEDIYANYTGVDNAEKIRNYLKDVYINFGSTYVLLGGDVTDISGAELMPVRQVDIAIAPSEGPSENFRETDYYFATVQGTWNQNANSTFAESSDATDYSAVFFVGRAPARNLTEATDFSNRIINYENLTDGSTALTDPGYVNNVSFFDGIAGYAGLNTLANAGGFLQPSAGYNVLRVYDPISMGPSGTIQLNSANAIIAMNQGGAGFSLSYNKLHLIYHMDHSGFDNMSTGSGSGGGGISPSDMDALSNGDYSSIIYSDGCHPNDFLQNSVSKHFLRNTNGGGVAFIGNVAPGWSGDYTMFTGRVANALYKPGTKLSGLFDYQNENYHIGYITWWSAVSSGSAYLKNRNLLGDPEMMVWTKTPQNLALSGLSYSESLQQVTGTVSGMTYVATPTVIVTVTAWKDGEIWASQDINATTSSIGFTLNNTLANTTGNIIVTAVAHNYIPQVGTIAVPPITNPHPYVTARTLVDDNTLGSTGNADAYPDAGETIAIPMTLTNAGTSTASTVTAVLSWTPDVYQSPTAITIVNANSNFGNITGGGSAANSGSEFTFTIDKDAFDAIIPRPLTQFINFTLDIYVNSTFYSSQPFAIQFGEPLLTRGENTATGTLLSGSSNQLKIKLYNMGMSEAVGLSATLITNNPTTVNITDGTDTYNDIDAVDNLSSNFGTNVATFDFDMVGANYSNETFNLTVTNAYGRVWTFNNFSLEGPVASWTVTTSGQLTSIDHTWNCVITAPAGDAILGYNIYRSPHLAGTYTKLNTNLLPYSLYFDSPLSQFTVYDYRLTVVDVNGNESAPYAYEASTSLGFHTGWPVPAEDNYQPIISRSEGSPNVFDVSDPPDGKKEIFFTTGYGNRGGLWAFNEDASRWYSYDNNVTNKSGYLKYDCQSMATPALADIDNDGRAEIGLTTNYNAVSPYTQQVYVYELDNGSWTPPTNQGSFPHTTPGNWELMKGVVFTDINNDGDKEILGNNFAYGTVNVYEPNGSAHSWANASTHNFGWSMPVAWDFDHDGNKEIVIGSTGTNTSGAGAGVYIFKQDGTDYLGSNPVHIPATGYRNDFPSVIVDLDGDKEPEILFVEAKDYTANLYAMRADGTFLTGWNSSSHPTCSLPVSVYSSSDSYTYNGQSCPTPSVGDLDKDGVPEVIMGSNGYIHVWSNTGGSTPLIDIPVTGLPTGTNIAPIIADVDSDPSDLEIIIAGAAVPTGTNIYALELSGGTVPGFPIFINDDVGNSACVDDIDNNGTNELIVSANQNFYVWDSPGQTSNNGYGWPGFRHDAQNTAVFPILNDMYVKDIPADDGAEPLPGYNPWNLCDGTGIWLRNSPATLTQTNPDHYTFEEQHENAEWSSNWASIPSSRPRIYAKIINRGGNAVTGTVHFYFHRFSTNDYWDAYGSLSANAWGSWEEILCGDTDGDGYINGSETACPPLTVTVPPGEYTVVEQVWNSVAQSDFQDPSVTGNRNEWCLLVRIESTQDPIAGEVLGVSAGLNAQISNNVTQKNVMFVNDAPGIICNPTDFGNESMTLTTNKLKITDESATSFTSSGIYKLDLGSTVYNTWTRARNGSGIVDGKQKYQHTASNGQVHNHLGFAADPSPYQVIITGSPAQLNAINIAANSTYELCSQFEFFEGAASSVPFKYNLVQAASVSGAPYKFTGAVNYYIDKPACPGVSTSGNVTIGRFCSTTLEASSDDEEATFIWRNNKTGEVVSTAATFSVVPHTTTTYEVEMRTPSHCIDYALLTVTVDADIANCHSACGDADITSKSLNANTTYSSETHVVNGIITVPSGKKLTILNSTLRFKVNSGIDVQAGGKLEIVNSTLEACSVPWKGITVKGNTNDAFQLSITGSTITDAIIPIIASKVLSPVMEDNIFERGLCAIGLGKCKNFTVSDNRIYDFMEGVHTNKSVLDDASVISGNYFVNSDTAILLQSGDHTNLDITCNTFDSYLYYAIYSDSTTLKNQGTSSDGPGNLFVSVSSQTNDKLHHYHGNSMTYYYDPSAPVILTSATGMTATTSAATNDAVCTTGGLRLLADNSLEEYASQELNNIVCIPNPAADKASIMYSLSGEQELAEIRISNTMGKLMNVFRLEDQHGAVAVDCSGWANGVYFYSLIVDNVVIETKKMVIAR